MTTTPQPAGGPRTTDAAHTAPELPLPRAASPAARARGRQRGEVLRTRVHWLGATAVVAAGGPLDMAGQDLVGDSVRDGLRGRPAVLVLDCGAVTFLDSAGADALLDAAEQADLCAASVRLVTSPAVERLFQLLELGTRFERIDSADEVIGA